MSAEMTIEQRVAVLEKEVAELKQQLPSLKPELSWFNRMAGSLKDFPEFDEVLRLGREIRQADRPADEQQGES